MDQPPRLRLSGLFGPDADEESDDGLTEEDTPLNFSTELAQLFNCDTEDEDKLLLRLLV